MTGKDPIPYRRSALTPNLGVLDSADDIRGGLGADGLAALQTFVREGGTLLGDGSTVELLANFGSAPGVSVSKRSQLYTKGALMRGVIADAASPIAYGYPAREMPIYFAGDPVLSVSGSVREGGNIYFDPNAPGAMLAQNITPNAFPTVIQPLERVSETGRAAQGVPPSASADAARTPPAPLTASSVAKPRVVMEFPAEANDILLSGLLSGGQTLSKRPLIVDVSLGRGHMVLYAIKPFWRGQTQGSYQFGFNAILNWDHLDAGATKAAAPATGVAAR
jgi:hypothetical protein